MLYDHKSASMLLKNFVRCVVLRSLLRWFGFFFFQRDEEKSFMVQLVELGLVETLNDSEMKSSGSPGGKSQHCLPKKLLTRHLVNILVRHFKWLKIFIGGRPT